MKNVFLISLYKPFKFLYIWGYISMVEYMLCKHAVIGSSPIISITIF